MGRQNQQFSSSAGSETVHGPDLVSNKLSASHCGIEGTGGFFYEDYVKTAPLLDSCLKLYQEVRKVAANCDIVVKPTVHNESNLCKRKNPPMGWVRVNVDGAVRERDGVTVCGGIIRNDQGEWIFGFSRSLGVCSPFGLNFGHHMMD
ncbi:uncharacterized protein LOC120164270 [Hibiscus syriacus]|uniref:uncharacterized protein LOC120164270 n=1 Tax=Hibiscus syriacus TaxID=106335 RepID=UPI0019224045|nr:uncharacterized protein LOC120164270 [Hibiscus syriacus]